MLLLSQLMVVVMVLLLLAEPSQFDERVGCRTARMREMALRIGASSATATTLNLKQI